MGGIDEHQLDDDGEHCPEECEVCIERDQSVNCECRCGKCCEQLIIEVSLRDGEREPLIRERARPIYDDMFGPREQIGWLLNDRERGHCTFFDPETRMCTIHATRPLCCRVFHCDKDMKEIENSLAEFGRTTDPRRTPE